MFRKALNKVFSSRVFYMLFSLLAAVALWTYVEITEHREESHTVSDVRVEFRNLDILRDKGLLISSFDPQTVSLTFTCSRSVASRLTNQTLAVEIDLSNIKSTGPTYLRYDILYPQNVTADEAGSPQKSVDRISLIVDRLSAWPVPVLVDYRGTTASDDLIADAPEYDPQVITVSGPEDIVSRVSHAFVAIPRESLASTFRDELPFVLFDDEGKELDEDLLASLNMEPEAVHVTIPIRQMKDLPLKVELVPGAGASELNTNVTITPEFVTVSGDPDALKDINSITLGTMDTARFGETRTEVYKIIYPDHITNLSGETEATVLFEVHGLEIAYLSTSNLHYINALPEHTVELITRSLDVRIRGRKEDLEFITEMNIRVVANVEGFPPGPARVPARIHVDGVNSDVGAVGEYWVQVRIIRDTT